MKERFWAAMITPVIMFVCTCSQLAYYVDEWRARWAGKQPPPPTPATPG
jgi:hypothetical protein